MSRHPIALVFTGLAGVSGLLAWANSGRGREPWQHRYDDAIQEGRLDPAVPEWRYEELEWKYGPYHGSFTGPVQRDLVTQQPTNDKC